MLDKGWAIVWWLRQSSKRLDLEDATGSDISSCSPLHVQTLLEEIYRVIASFLSDPETACCALTPSLHQAVRFNNSG
jgi:hypothetical protein